jgi:hypothetical protein
MKVIKFTKKIRIVMRAVVGLCFLLTAGTALAQKVSVDYDKDTDFSRYKTYAFAEGTPTPVSLTNQRIQQAIETQLAARGLMKVENGADLTVTFHCAVTERTQLNTTNFGGWGWGPGWGRGWGWRGGWRGGWGGLGGNAITQVEQIPVGTLIVDIGDTASKKYLWRGTGTKTLSSDQSKNEKTIDQEVKKMFEKFPPKEKN